MNVVLSEYLQNKEDLIQTRFRFTNLSANI